MGDVGCHRQAGELDLVGGLVCSGLLRVLRGQEDLLLRVIVNEIAGGTTDEHYHEYYADDQAYSGSAGGSYWRWD